MDTWNMKSDVKQTLDQTKDKVTETYHDVKDKMGSTAERVKEKASDLYEGGKHHLDALESTMEEYSIELIRKVRRHPLSSLLIAGGVGFILSRLMKK